MAKPATTTQKATDKGRFYDTPDGCFPSVTNILGVVAKPALVGWAAKAERESVINAAVAVYEAVCDGGAMSLGAFESAIVKRLGDDKAHARIMQKAGQIGSIVHACIEWGLRAKLGLPQGTKPILTREAEPSYRAYEAWNAIAQLAPVSIEQTVWSKSLGYAGTMDVLGRVTIGEERLDCVLDWKSSSGIYDEALAQVSAYCHAVVEMGLATAPIHGLVVRLPKDGKRAEQKLVRWDEQPVHMAGFKSAIGAWAWVNR